MESAAGAGRAKSRVDFFPKSQMPPITSAGLHWRLQHVQRCESRAKDGKFRGYRSIINVLAIQLKTVAFCRPLI